MMSCYYPTTVVAIDDDQGFLTAIGRHLEISKHNLYTSPLLAIQNINKSDPYDRIKSRLLHPNRALHEISDTMNENYSVTINPHRLHEEIYSPERFNDISILIVDYHMGDINGIDVCRKLADHPAKKILLTGATDKEKIAIEAFNQGIIHRFISKADRDISLQLSRTIAMLKDNYFRDLTYRLMPHLPDSNAAVLNNLAYVNLVKSLQLQLSASEYYLFDISGSVLFFSDDGTPSWLLVKNEDELRQYEEIARNSDGADKTVQSIENRELMPFFLSENDFAQPASNWGEYLYPATSLAGADGCYYSLIQGHVKNNLILNKIIPFNAYTNNK